MIAHCNMNIAPPHGEIQKMNEGHSPTKDAESSSCVVHAAKAIEIPTHGPR